MTDIICFKSHSSFHDKSTDWMVGGSHSILDVVAVMLSKLDAGVADSEVLGSFADVETLFTSEDVPK